MPSRNNKKTKGTIDMEFPITIENQEEFDQLINTRLSRARKSFEEESGVDKLQAELDALKEAREAEIAAIREEATKRELDREVTSLLDSYGVDRSRHKSIRTLLDLEGVEPSDTVPREGVLDNSARELVSRVSKLYEQTPELFGEGAKVASPNAPETGGGRPSLTFESIKGMSPGEISADWDRVQATLSRYPSEDAREPSSAE